MQVSDVAQAASGTRGRTEVRGGGVAVAYRIRNWSRHYETNKTRPLKTLSWISLPIALDNDGYAELMENENGVAHFGVFVAILEVAARCVPRGCLLRARGVPHDAPSLARVCRIPVPIVQEALDRLVTIGWIEIWHTEGTTEAQDGHLEGTTRADDGHHTGDTLHYTTEPTGHNTTGREDRLDTTNRDDRSYEREQDLAATPNPPTGGSPSPRVLETEKRRRALKARIASMENQP